MEFVSIDTWTIIFTWINLIILMFVMKKLLFKPVMKMLAERENEVGSMYEKAESAQQNAEKLEGEYTQKLSEAKEEAARIMKDATDAANKKGEQIVFEAQQKASASILKAQKEIEREKLNAVSEIKKDIASIAVSVAEKVMSELGAGEQSDYKCRADTAEVKDSVTEALCRENAAVVADRACIQEQHKRERHHSAGIALGCRRDDEQHYTAADRKHKRIHKIVYARLVAQGVDVADVFNAARLEGERKCEGNVEDYSAEQHVLRAERHGLIVAGGEDRCGKHHNNAGGKI